MTTAPDLKSDPQFLALTREVEGLEVTIVDYQIVDAAGFESAGALLKRIKTEADKAETLRLSITRPMDAAKKVVMDLFAGPAKRLTDAEGVIKRAMVRYQDEQAAIAREAQRKADAEAAAARRAAEEKAAAARAKADADRRAAEEADRKAREAKDAEARAAAEKEAARLRASAERADTRAGNADQVAQTTVAPMVVSAPPKVTGINTKQVWKFAVENPALVPREYLSVDEAKIRGVVQSLKGAIEIPGVRIYAESQIAAGKG